MTLTDHIEKIKARCREVLELDAKATPNVWALTHREPEGSSRAPRNVIGPRGSTFEPGKMRTCVCAPHQNEDADFIVEAKSFTPTAARAVLGVIEVTDKRDHGENCASESQFFHSSCNCWKAYALRAIAEQFPMEDGE